MCEDWAWLWLEVEVTSRNTHTHTVPDQCAMTFGSLLALMVPWQTFNIDLHKKLFIIIKMSFVLRNDSLEQLTDRFCGEPKMVLLCHHWKRKKKNTLLEPIFLRVWKWPFTSLPAHIKRTEIKVVFGWWRDAGSCLIDRIRWISSSQILVLCQGISTLALEVLKSSAPIKHSWTSNSRSSGLLECYRQVS